MYKERFEQSDDHRWKLISVAFLCFLALIAGGCGQTNYEHTKTYSHDGYMGYSNSNPNLPGRYMSLNYEADGNMVEQVLKPINGIDRTQVYFNGTDMHVNLQMNKNLSDAEVKHLREKAQSVVQNNMPRYHVHVEIKR
ncbi:MAG: hypothetical protein ACQEXQ_25985 [Bacillota bacterium]